MGAKNETDERIVRAWSAVVARGQEGTPAEVHEELRRQGVNAGASLWPKMQALWAHGRLP